MECHERAYPAPATKEGPAVLRNDCAAELNAEPAVDRPSTILPACVEPDFLTDKTYTAALLRGRHPRSFRKERGIYQYVNDSNRRASRRQKGYAQYHKNRVLPDPNCLPGQTSSDIGIGGIGGGTNCSSRSQPAAGVNLTDASLHPDQDHVDESIRNDDPHGRQQLFPSPLRRTLAGADGEGSPHNDKGMSRGPRGQHQHHQHHQHQHQHQQSVSWGQSSGIRERGSVSRRRPRSGASPPRGGVAEKRPAISVGRGTGDPLGGYAIQQGGDDAHDFVGGGVLAGAGRGGGVHSAQQGRNGDRPLSVHQKCSTPGGIQLETSREEEIQVLDSLNDDPLLRLHYGLHVTFQTIQGENGYFMALDMETGGVSMIPLHGLKKHQQVTFKMIDLEDPESYRSIFYGCPVWLQIVPGPGEPTWKQGSVLGARVHEPGMLPTVVINSNFAVESASTSHQPGGPPRPRISEGCASAVLRPASTPGAPPLAGNGNHNGRYTARNLGGGDGGGDRAESACARSRGGGAGGGGGGGGGTGGAGRVASAVAGGGNTDANRPVGVPYPFRAAAVKHGSAGGTGNETLIRVINKNAIVNCRWTVRPVFSDGQSLPGKDGKEVSNMDYVYFEQDFFYMTRVSENASVVLKALSHGNRSRGNGSAGGIGGGGGKRGTPLKHYPVGRRGVFKVQVADADELRPGEERSAALMRKAKRGLKRSEARRSGQRTYVHKQRPGDHLPSGAAFARAIRVRTTHFASESESRAISNASQSPPHGRVRGILGDGSGSVGVGGDVGGSEDASALVARPSGKVVGTGSGPGAGGGREDCFAGGGGGTSRYSGGMTSSAAMHSFPTGSWGTRTLQAMTDAARAPAAYGIAATHARVLREWRQRWRGPGTTVLHADDHGSQGSTKGPDDSNEDNENDNGGGDGDGSGERREVHVSPMCPRCRYLTLNPFLPLPSPAATFTLTTSAAITAASAAAAAAAAPADEDAGLGRYCLCTVNREIQLEVMQGNTSGSHAKGATAEAGASARASTPASTATGTDVGTPSFGNIRMGDETFAIAPSVEGLDHPGPAALSRTSTPGNSETAVAGAGSGEPGSPLNGARETGKGGAAARNASVGGLAEVARLPSANASGESGPFSFAGGRGIAGGVPGQAGGLKRTRERRADRRKKKDLFEALEERMLDGFSLESITRRLQQQDETLQKGVRHVERLKLRGNQTGRRSNEEHQRYLLIQKKRFEAVVTDSIAEALGAATGQEGEAKGGGEGKERKGERDVSDDRAEEEGEEKEAQDCQVHRSLNISPPKGSEQ